MIGRQDTGGSMGTKSWVVAGLVCVVAGFSARPTPAAGCDPAGGAEFICGLNGPEDLLRGPETDWVLVSSMGTGKSHLYAVDAKTRTPTALYPADRAREQQDKRTYSACPGPLPKGALDSHGIDLRSKARGKGTVFV